MNQRLNLREIAAHLADQPALASVHVGTSFDHDFLSSFGEKYPAVVVDAQRLTRIDDGRGLTGEYRQHCKVEVLFRLVAQRYAPGEVEPDVGMDQLHDAVSAALTRFRPSIADDSFVWESCTDGDRSESVMTCDLVMSVTTTYASNAP